MKKITQTFFLFFIIISFYSCQNSNYVQISGEIPIDSLRQIQVMNYMSGKEVFIDSAVNKSFDFKIDSLPLGVYQVVFSWNRYLVTPAELKMRAKYDIQEDSQFYISKLIWVDKAGKKSYKISMDKGLDQAAIEDYLVNNKYDFFIHADANESHAQEFEKFLQIGYRYIEKNMVKKDSLKSLMYSHVESQNYEEIRRINALLNASMLDEVKKGMVSEEVSFLKNHQNNMMIPYILFTKISSKEDFANYKEIYDAIHPTIKAKIENRFTGFM